MSYERDTVDTDRIMFEVYRDVGPHGQYRVVYFTELEEHERDREIAAAFKGEHVLDGFIAGRDRDAARSLIAAILGSLNGGAAISTAEFEARLQPYLVR